MPYCGRCLNVGRAGGGERHQNTAQFNLDSGASSGSTDSEQGQHAICGKPALLDLISSEHLEAGSGEMFCRINTAAFSPR